VACGILLSMARPWPPGALESLSGPVDASLRHRAASRCVYRCAHVHMKRLVVGVQVRLRFVGSLASGLNWVVSKSRNNAIWNIVLYDFVFCLCEGVRISCCRSLRRFQTGHPILCIPRLDAFF